MRENRDLSIDEAVHLASRLDDEGHSPEAERLLRTCIEADPDCFLALVRLATVRAKDPSGLHEAFYLLWKALKINSKSGWALGCYGMVLGELGHQREAAKYLRMAIEREPKNPIHWDNLGNTLERLGQYEESIRAFDKAVELEPTTGIVYHNRSVALLRSGQIEKALPDLRKAIEMSPEIVDARFNMGLTALLLGDYDTGFKHYEARWETKEYAGYRKVFPWPKWIGDSDIRGKKILVLGDQGLGDMIMFSRYLPLLVATGADVHAIAHVPLFDIMQATFDPMGVKVLSGGEPLPDVEVRTAFASLPLAFKTTLDTIPPPVPFNAMPKADPRRPGPLRVGVCWSGNFRHKNDANRSIPFAQFAGLLASVPDVHWVSLQQEVREDDRPAYQRLGRNLEVHNLGSFIETAAVVDSLDLVITVDTSVAHLAATQGKPTWVLLPARGSDWRWMRIRTDSPWYPSVTLWRQRTHGDWPGALREVSAKLHQMVRQVAA